jgi:hypothetical protein
MFGWDGRSGPRSLEHRSSGISVKVLGLGLQDPEGLLKTLGVPEHD